MSGPGQLNAIAHRDHSEPIGLRQFPVTIRQTPVHLVLIASDAIHEIGTSGVVAPRLLNDDFRTGIVLADDGDQPVRPWLVGLPVRASQTVLLDGDDVPLPVQKFRQGMFPLVGAVRRIFHRFLILLDVLLKRTTADHRRFQREFAARDLRCDLGKEGLHALGETVPDEQDPQRTVRSGVGGELRPHRERDARNDETDQQQKNSFHVTDLLAFYFSHAVLPKSPSSKKMDLAPPSSVRQRTISSIRCRWSGR